MGHYIWYNQNENMYGTVWSRPSSGEGGGHTVKIVKLCAIFEKK